MKVNLWFARENDNEIVGILNSNSENEYSCPICSSKVIPKAVESNKVTPHFAHIDVSKCSSEAMIHWWYKNKFIERGDNFKIFTDEEIEFTCKDFNTEVTYQLDSGTYRPDLVIFTECGQEVVFEMANSNKKKVQDYIDKWIELDRIIVEVDIKTLQSEVDIKVFSALYFKGKCFNFNKRDGGYYSTIGKLKEEMKSNGHYDVEMVRKLDWFWLELNKYNTFNKEFTYFFDSLDSDFKKSIYSSKHTKCIEFFNDFKKHKIKELQEAVSESPYLNIEIKNTKLKVFKTKDFHLMRDTYERMLDINILTSTLEDSLRDISKIKKYISDERSSRAFIDNLKNNTELQKGLLLFKDYVSSYEELTFRYKDVWGGIQDNCSIDFNYKPLATLKLKENVLILNSVEFFEYLKENFTKVLSENREVIKVGNLRDMVSQLNNALSPIEKSSLYYVKSRRKHGKYYVPINLKMYNREYFLYKIEECSPVEKTLVFIKEDNGSEILWQSKISKESNYEFDQLFAVALGIISKNIQWECEDCSESYELKSSELKFFLDKGFELPKRCSSCRKKRKQDKLKGRFNS